MLIPTLLAQQASTSTNAANHLLRQVDEEVLIFGLGMIVFFGSLVVIVATIATAKTVSTISKRRIEAGLKRDMLDRGMTPEEIVAVIEASPDQKPA